MIFKLFIFTILLFSISAKACNTLYLQFKDTETEEVILSEITIQQLKDSISIQTISGYIQLKKKKQKNILDN